MPKPKAKPTPKSSPSIRSTDVKDFLADLENPDHPLMPSAPAPTASPKLKSTAPKKIAVRQDETPAGKPAADAKPPLEDVLKKDESDPPSGTGSDLGKFQRGPKKPFPWGWVIGILAAVTLAAVAGFFFFNQKRQFSGEKVQLTIETSTTAASGSDLTLTIQYHNLEPVDIVQAELLVEYPDGFSVTDTSQPSNSEFNNAFTIGTVKSGRAGSLTIDGTIFGSVDTERGFTVTLTYRPSNFSSDFQVMAEALVKITSSILEIEIDGPKQLAPSAAGTWTIRYHNSSTRDLENVQIENVYPAGLQVTAVDPEATERSAVWRFDTIAQGEEGTITVTGTATGEVGDTLELLVRAGLVTPTNTVDLQAEQKLLVVLIHTGVTPSISVNGETEDSSVVPGETMQYAIRIANLSEAEVADLTVTVEIEGVAADFDELENPNRATRDGQQLTWTKEQVLALELLKPGQDVTLRFSLGTISSITVEEDDDIDQAITATVNISSPSLPEPEAGSAPTTFVTKLATTMLLQAQSRYYNDTGIAYGTGPVPPVVGETTTYRMIWSVTNTSSDANDLTVTASLPTHVFWTGVNVGRDAGDISFDPSARTVTWRLNTVPAGTGSRLPTLSAYFEVSITPTSSQVGSSVVLVQTSTAKATDSFTGRAIEVTQPSLTSDIPNDPIAPGEGAVQAAP